MNLVAIRRVRSLLIIAIDIIAAIFAFSLLYYLRLERLPDYSNISLWLIITTFIGTLFLSGTYFKEKRIGSPRLPVRTFFIVSIGGIICVFWVYLLGPNQFNNYFGRGVLPLGTILFGVCATYTRFFINRIYHHQESNTDLLYLGYSDSTNALLKELQNHSEVRSVYIFTEKTVDVSSAKVTIIKPGDGSIFNHKQWQGVIIDPSHHPDQAESEQLVNLRLTGVPIMTLAEYYENFWYMVPVDHIGHDWFLRSQGFSMLGNPISNRIKRLFDISLAITILMISLPIILACALLIKLTSPGPVFFKQTRVGLRGKHFTIIKLRTMRQDAEKAGAQWAQDNDPRITKVGNFLRRSRLDELPQCWNVLKSDMSFVGPRPERPEFTQQLAQQIPYYDLRHLVKPGISGWAQVIFPYGASVEDAVKKLQYELYYIKQQSLLLDLNIILRTTFTVFQRSGR